MTLTIELPPEIESAFDEEAHRRGVAPSIIAAEVLYAWAEDAADNAEADRIMAVSDPSERVPWEQLEAELGL